MRKAFAVRALLAVSLLLLATAEAGARNGLRASPSSFAASISNMELAGGFGTVRCDVHLWLTLHSSVSKANGALAGQTSIIVTTDACTTGNAGLLVGARRVTGVQGPYHVQYVTFSGTLPSISSVTLRVVGVEFWISEPTFGVTCLTSGPQNITGISTGGNPATGVRIATTGINLEGGFGCEFTTGSMSGAGSFIAFPGSGGRTSVTITLV